MYFMEKPRDHLNWVWPRIDLFLMFWVKFLQKCSNFRFCMGQKVPNHFFIKKSQNWRFSWFVLGVPFFWIHKSLDLLWDFNSCRAFRSVLSHLFKSDRVFSVLGATYKIGPLRILWAGVDWGNPRAIFLRNFWLFVILGLPELS